MAEAAGALTRQLLRTQHAAWCSDWSVLTGRMKVVGHMGLNLSVTCQNIVAPAPGPVHSSQRAEVSLSVPIGGTGLCAWTCLPKSSAPRL